MDYQLKKNDKDGTWETSDAYNIWLEGPKGKRTLVRHRRRWQNNFKMELRVMGLEGVGSIHLVQGRGRWWAFVNAVLDFRILGFCKKDGNFLTS